MQIYDLLATIDRNVRDDPVVGHVPTCHGKVIEHRGQIHTAVSSRRTAFVEGH